MVQLSATQVKHTVNEILSEHFQQAHQSAQTIDSSYARLWQVMDELLSAGGKRLRPYLTYIAYQAFDGDMAKDIFQVAAAQELLHFALLIHDDIIDRDFTRYGRKNIAGSYRDTYSSAKSDAEHYAYGAALLAGDLALSQAYQLISTSNFEATLKTAAITQFGVSLFNVAGGELLDMEGAIPGTGEVDYFKIAEFKTASYSFVGPLITGAQLASATEQQQALLRQYGINLGIAYQLSDDLLGLHGSEQATGKPITSDLREGKQTYLFQQIAQRSSPQDKQFFESVWGNPQVTIEDVDKVRRISKDSGAWQACHDLMADYAQKARQALDKLDLPSQHKLPFEQLINKSINRDK